MTIRALPSFFAAALSLALCAQPAVAQIVELKVSHYLPPNHQMHKALETWAADLAKQSNGRLALKVFPAGQMGPPPRQFDLARTGVADLAFFIHGFLPGRFPLTEVAHLPYVFNRGQGAAAQVLSTADASGLLTELAPQLAGEHEGTKILYMVATPTLGLFFNKATVRTPADMRGLRMRHNGPVASAMLDAWGSVPAAIAPAELADALSKGTIAGMILNFEAAKSFQLGESVKTVTPLHAAAGTFALVMNGDKYKSLPDDLRKLIDDTTGAAAARQIGKLYDEAEIEGRKYLEAAKVQIVELTLAERAAFEDAVKPVAAGIVAKGGAGAKAMLDQIRAKVESSK